MQVESDDGRHPLVSEGRVVWSLVRTIDCIGRLIPMLCWGLMFLSQNAPAADALGDLRLFYTAAERLSMAARNAEITAASHQAELSPPPGPTHEITEESLTSARADGDKAVGGMADADAQQTTSAAGGTAIRRASRSVVRSGFRVSAVLSGQVDVQVLVGDQLCRTRGGPTLQCSHMPTGVRTLAWEAASGRVIVEPLRGTIARLAIGEQWNP